MVLAPDTPTDSFTESSSQSGEEGLLFSVLEVQLINSKESACSAGD